MNPVKLSKKIRDLRYAKGWGPDELADRAKISRTALYQIERGGTSKPQAGTLRRISRALGVPLEALLAAVETSEAGDSALSEPVTAVAIGSRSGPSSVVASSERAEELIEKFRVLLASPLAEGVARIVEESFRLLPIIPASVMLNQPRYATSLEFDSVREGRSHPFKHA